MNPRFRKINHFDESVYFRSIGLFSVNRCLEHYNELFDPLKKRFSNLEKDENIIINLDTLQCSLIDFGCATEMTNQSTSIFCGTLEFYPPEYYQTGYYNQSDLTSWSVGLVLYLLLIGHLPFNSVDELLNFDIETNSGISDLKNAHISPEATLLLKKLLARDPLQRANLETAKNFGLAFLNH